MNMLNKNRSAEDLNKLAFTIVIVGILVFGAVIALVFRSVNLDPKPPKAKSIPTMSAMPAEKK